MEPIRNGEIFELTINKLKIKSCTDGEDDWNLTLIFAGAFLKMNSKGFIYCQHPCGIGLKGPNFVGSFEDNF